MIVRKPTNGIYVGTVKIGDYAIGKHSIYDYHWIRFTRKRLLLK